MRNLVLNPKTLPIRFRLGDDYYCGMPDGTVTSSENNKIIYTAMVGKIEVRAECVSYDDFDASEWTVYFSNKGDTVSPHLFDVDVMNYVFKGECAKIYTSNGDFCSSDGYAVTETCLSTGAELRIVPYGGRSCNTAFPYHRITFGNRGVNLAVGWPGQWKSYFRGTDDGVLYAAGQEVLDTVINPGESLRTPLMVVVSFDGDIETGINVWRRWYFKHVGITKPHLVGCFSGFGLEFTHATEENQIKAISDAVNNRLGINLWWLDAGWYPAVNDVGEDDWWGTLGDWKPDSKRFPNGLAPIGKECEKHGIDFLLWFESERVTEHSEICREHPEWIIDKGVKMLDLSIPACVDYLIKKIGNCIEEGHVTVYRQDYNFEPEDCWRSREGENRRGAIENLYEQEYLRFWDTLKARFPELQIDSCASGGRRNDIETMRRSVPLHQTDYGYGIHPVQQAFSQTLYSWIPYFRGFAESWEKEDGSYDDGKPPKNLPEFDEYTMLSFLAPTVHLGRFTNVKKPLSEETCEKIRRYSALFNRVAPVICSADFYALTPYHKSREKWTSWQFDIPEEDRGVIEVIRNNAAPDGTLTVKPHLREGRYVFRNLWNGETFRYAYTGGSMAFSQPIRSARIWEYARED